VCEREEEEEEVWLRTRRCGAAGCAEIHQRCSVKKRKRKERKRKRRGRRGRGEEEEREKRRGRRGSSSRESDREGGYCSATFLHMSMSSSGNHLALPRFASASAGTGMDARCGRCGKTRAASRTHIFTHTSRRCDGDTESPASALCAYLCMFACAH